MVICLHKKIYNKIFITILLILFIVCSGYYFNFITYNNKDIIETEVLRQTNEVLKEELNKSKKISNFKEDYVIARVILRDIHNFYNEIVINVGDNEVKEGDAVINEDGLIGIIKEVKKDVSYVKLLDNSYNLSVKVNDTYGNLKGNKVDLLNKYSEFREGDLIYTSGLTNIPEGIYVGRIDKVKMDQNGLGKELEVTLVDNSNLIYVGIISKIE